MADARPTAAPRRPTWRSVAAPGALLLAGALLSAAAPRPQPRALVRPLATLPDTIQGLPGVDVPVDTQEVRVAGVSSYLLRAFAVPGSGPVSVYVGYYASQTEGRNVHSPELCLPGAGWMPVSSRIVRVPTEAGPVPAFRYLIRNRDRLAVTYYWFQGRGRRTTSLVRLRLELFRDAVIAHRTDEALARVVVPVGSSGEAGADIVAARFTAALAPALDRVLPPPDA